MMYDAEPRDKRKNPVAHRCLWRVRLYALNDRWNRKDRNISEAHRNFMAIVSESDTKTFRGG